jgi:hypothetical protein
MKKLLGIAAMILIIVCAIFALSVSRPDISARKAVETTLQALHNQRFKTNLSDFDLSTPTEVRARETILFNTTTSRNSNPFVDHPNLMEVLGNDSAIVVWKQDSLKHTYPSWPDNSDVFTWDEFREAINTNQTQIDAACAAILSGPISFNLNASAGNAMLLPHLAMLKNLTQTLGDRVVLDLHDGNQDAAWTNLMASTRLVTAWKTEPAEISQLVRFGNTSLVFDNIWQALQTNCWSDEQLARLQQEWESVDFFTNLPEVMAFKRACYVAECQQERNPPLDERFSPAEFSKEAFRHPSFVWPELNSLWKHNYYLKHGSYQDETNLLIFFRDRELELRNAVQATTWSQMRQLPGVTNKIFFQSKFSSRLKAMMSLQDISVSFMNRGFGFLGRAAEAEARRRILISAIALERFREKNGSYPKTLAELVPEFIKTTPVDFMDGQPLRYRLTADGHFVLYSVGLDCVADGGIIQTREQRIRANQEAGLIGIPPEADIVWPLPASNAAVADLRQQQLDARQKKAAEIEDFEARSQWDHTARHQADVEKLLASPAPQNPQDINYHGHPLSEILRNQNVAGTNVVTLGQMLTLKQIITGDEPETVTFEAPIAYDVVTKLGNLCLFIDTNNDDYDEGCYMKLHLYSDVLPSPK